MYDLMAAVQQLELPHSLKSKILDPFSNLDDSISSLESIYSDIDDVDTKAKKKERNVIKELRREKKIARRQQIDAEENSLDKWGLDLPKIYQADSLQDALAKYL